MGSLRIEVTTWWLRNRQWISSPQWKKSGISRVDPPTMWPPLVVSWVTGLGPNPMHQMVDPCRLKFGISFNLCHGNHCISCPSSQQMVLDMVLGAAYVSDGASFSLDVKIVEFPVLIMDLPLKVGSFHCLLVQAVWLTRFCHPDRWRVAAAWRHVSSVRLVELLADASRSRLWTSTFEWLWPLPERSQHGKAMALLLMSSTLCNMTLTGCLGRRFPQRNFKDKSMDVASASLPQSGIEQVAHHDSSRESCQPNFGANRSAIGYEGRGIECEVASCAWPILFLHFSDRKLVITFSATCETWAMAHTSVFFPPFHFPGRSMPGPCPRTALHSWQQLFSQEATLEHNASVGAAQSDNVCQQLVKHPWQVAGGELPKLPVICVQSRLFGCRSACTG